MMWKFSKVAMVRFSILEKSQKIQDIFTPFILKFLRNYIGLKQ